MSRRLVWSALALCLLTRTAGAQTNPCTDPVTGVTVNPRTINAVLPDYARTLVNGAVAVPSYEFGWMVEGATTPTSSLPPIPKASWTLVTGTTTCYTTSLPTTSAIPVGQKFVAALRGLGDPEIGNGPWSPASNPFGFNVAPVTPGKPAVR